MYLCFTELGLFLGKFQLYSTVNLFTMLHVDIVFNLQNIIPENVVKDF